MSENITIELREQSAQINNSDGDYQIVLPEPIPLYPNDIIEIKNVFIDAVESNDTAVVIEEDTQVEVQFSNYMINYLAPNVPTKVHLSNDAQPDLEPYFACNKAIQPNMADVFAVGTIRIFRTNDERLPWGRPPDQPPLVLKFSYPDPTDATTNIIKQIQFKYQTGEASFADLTYTNNPTLLPFFIKGQSGDLIQSPSLIKLLNPEDILATDNIDKTTLINGNADGSPRGLSTYLNLYNGNKFGLMTGFQVAQQGSGGTFGNGAEITFEFQDWRDGIFKQKQFKITNSFSGNNFETFLFTPNIDCVIGAIPVNQPFTDSLGTMKYINPTPFPQDCPISATPFSILTIDENGDSSFFMNKILVSPAQLDNIVNIKTNLVSFLLKAGIYPLPQLCEILTDNFTNLNKNSSEFVKYPSNNPFLLTADQIRTENGLGASDNQFFVRADGKSFFTYGAAPSPDPFVGTDQVAFIADSTLNNKVKISAIHQNLLDIAGTTPSLAPVTQYVKKGDDNYVINGRNGGIVFTSMTPQTFWEKLGFSYETDKTIIANTPHVSTLIAGIRYLTNSIPIEQGRYTTTSDSGLSSAVIKTNPYVFKGLDTLEAGSSTSSNIEIVATNTIAQESNNEGYFMIEVNGIPQNSLVGSDFQSNKINAIISRYNTVGSYTSSYNEGSIPNQYRGEPTMIGSFNVRILNPDGTLSKDIQNKSSIFLSITRGNKTPAEQNLIN